MGVVLELVGGLVAHQLEDVAALDQRLPFRCQPFQLDGFDLGAVLFPLGSLLCHFVVIEFALDPVDGAVKHIHRRPKQILEVGFEARLRERYDQGVEDVGDAARENVRFGKRPWVGFIVEGALAVELKLLENAVGG